MVVANFTTELVNEVLGGQCNILAGSIAGMTMTIKYVIIFFILGIIYSSINFWLKKLWEFIDNKYFPKRKK